MIENDGKLLPFDHFAYNNLFLSSSLHIQNFRKRILSLNDIECVQEDFFIDLKISIVHTHI